jgi:pentatricopeptide repeat protein
MPNIFTDLTGSSLTNRSKMKLASSRLNLLMKNINEESADEAYKIIKMTYDYAYEHIPKYTYEKCILRFLSRIWNNNLYQILDKLICNICIVDNYSADIYIPYCIVKFKRFREIDKDYLKYIGVCSDKFRRKLLCLYGCIKVKSINKEENCINKEENCINKEENCINKEENCINKKENCINKKENFVGNQIVIKYEENKNFFFKDTLFTDSNIICDFSRLNVKTSKNEFFDYYSRKIITNLPGNLFSILLNTFLEGNYKNCKDLIKIIFKDNEISKLHVYNILVYCYVQMGMYQESIYYLNKSISMSEGRVRWYFLNYKFCIERIGGIIGPTSYLRMKISEDLNLSFISISQDDFINKKLTYNISLEDSSELVREIRNLEDNLVKFNTLGNLITISIFVVKDLLHISVLRNNQYKVFNTLIKYAEISNEFNRIINKNKEILKYEKDQEKWWSERIRLDRDLKILMKSIKYNLEISDETVLLVLDEKTIEFPFEYTEIFYKKRCYRILSMEYINNENYIDDNEDTKIFLLDTLLTNTYTRITNKFKDIKNINKINIVQDTKITKNGLICYFGHGNGCKYISEDINNSVLFLFGCSSVRLICVNNYKKNGKVLKYIKSNRIVLGCLYEVTDKDLDIFSMELLSREGDIVDLVKECRQSMKLKYLNGCSIVVYGLPYRYK